MVAQGHLSRIRRLAGISQDVIATTLGCSQAAVSQWERGVVPPDPALALDTPLLGVRPGGQLGR